MIKSHKTFTVIFSPLGASFSEGILLSKIKIYGLPLFN